MSVIWKSTEYGYYNIAYGGPCSISISTCYNTLTWYDTYINSKYTYNYYTNTTKTFYSWNWYSTSTIYFSTTRKYTIATILPYSCTYISTFVTFSTNATKVVYWKSTDYGRYDVAYDWIYSFSSINSCSNTLTSVWGTYINSKYSLRYYTSTTKAFSSATWSSTSTIYFLITHAYTATYASYTITSTLTNSDTYSTIKTVIDILGNTDTMAYYTTDIQYSTITMILAPSPSIVPKDKCTCVFQLCNKLDLVLLTINNIV
jgi:hypothetical protein